jgi:hypothetical protein
MPDLAINSRAKQSFSTRLLLEYNSTAAITVGVKKEWIVPCYGRILDVICDSEVANDGADDIIDIHKNGTTIFTTQANRPTLTDGDTGMFSQAGRPQVTNLSPGDILLLEIDQVGSTSGSARFKAIIVVGLPS